MISKTFFLFFLAFFFIKICSSATEPASVAQSAAETIAHLKKTCSLESVGSDIELLEGFVPTKAEGLSKEDVRRIVFSTQSKKIPSLKFGCISIVPLTYQDGRYKKFTTADQIFFVFVKERCLPTHYEGPRRDRLLFVVKHYAGNKFSQKKVEDELANLCVLKRTFSSQGFSANFPRLSFAEAFYKYPNPDRSLDHSAPYRYVALIHAAKGENLWDLVENYIKTENEKEKSQLRHDVLTASARLGEVLAHFHLKFMEGKGCPYRRATRLQRLKSDVSDISKCQTTIHGDLHFKNIFWDKTTNIISWVDISALMDRPSPLNFLEELGYIYGSLINFTTSLFGKGEIEFLKRRTLIADIYSAFLKAYLEVFHTHRGGVPYADLERSVKSMVLPLAMLRAVGTGPSGDVTGPAWREIVQRVALA